MSEQDKSFNRNKLYIDTSIGASTNQQPLASPLPPPEWPQETTPFFLPTSTLVVLYAADSSMQLLPKIKPKMDRGFFITPNGAGSDWTCYRRNYFQISSAFALEDQDGMECNAPCYLKDQGTSYAVESFAIGIDAKVCHGDRKIGIVQHTPKRDKGPQITPTPKEVLAGGNPFQYSGLSASKFVATFERLQFKSATANNGKRRAAQQFFTIILDLYAVVNGKHLKVATCESSQLVVRGRSPGHYSDNAVEPSVHFHEMQPKNGEKSPTEEHSPYPPNSANSLVSPAYPYLTPESRFNPYPTATSTSSSWLRSRGDSAESLQSYITNDSYASSFDDGKPDRQPALNFSNPAFPRLAQYSPITEDANKFQSPFPRAENRFYSGIKNSQIGQVLSPVTPIATDTLIPPSVEDNQTPDFDNTTRFTYDNTDRSYNNRLLRLPKGVPYGNEELYTNRQDSFQSQDSFQRHDTYTSQESFQPSFTENRDSYTPSFTEPNGDTYSNHLYSVDNFGNNAKMEYTQSQTESQ
ncbi:meiosis-specific transcription factor ndt80 [Terramyces sp. JEL0728]|nr:meiosis-specific transcription factor ndt80 [Terramyces sp. JEL0728]